MANIKLGTGHFQILRVLNHLRQNEDSFMVICQRWEELGCSLGLSNVEIAKVKEKLTLETLTLMEIPRELLRIWRNGHGDEANLRVLFDALLDINLRDVAGSVRDEFNGTTEPPVLSLEVPPAPASNGLGVKRRNNESREVPEIASSSSSSDGSLQPLEQSPLDSLFPVVLPEKPSFMISTLENADKVLMKKTIEDLGGRVSALQIFDKDCDAFIAEKLIRSEKILASIASGKLLLKPDYIKQSQEAGRFLPIDKKFLWHEDDANNDTERELARASFTWCIAQMRDPESRKPLTGMRFFVIEQDINKEAAYLRLILAGGGVMVNSIEEATMILKDEKHSVQTPPGTELKNAMILNHLILSLPDH